MNRNVSTVDYKISRFFIQMRTNVNVTYASESLSKTMAVCRRLPATEPLDTQQPGAARRWPAREHPGGPFGVERGRRRPRKSGAGRVSPSRRPRPRKPGSSFGRWAPKVQRGPRRHPPYSLKGSVPEAPAYVSVRLCMDLGGGGGGGGAVVGEAVKAHHHDGDMCFQKE